MTLQQLRTITTKAQTGVRSHLDFLKNEYFSQFFLAALVNVLLVLGQFIFLLLRYNYLNDAVPVWYSMPWGDLQLDYKRNLFIIPILSLLSTGIGLLFITLLKRLYVRYLSQIITLLVTAANITLSYSLVRVVLTTSTPYQSLIDPQYFPLIAPFIISTVLVYFFAPIYMNWARERGIVTDPSSHQHPGMILTKPSVRGGGIIFTICFLVVSLLLVPVSKIVIGIFVVALLLSLLGLADDYQNTHTKSVFKILETPYLRLFLLFLIVSLVPVFGIKFNVISNPLGGVLDFTGLDLVGSVVTVVWIVWVLNMLSWSNGIDGQYSGIIGIASLVIGLLALRFTPLLPEYVNYAKLAVIAAGCSLGLVRFTWHPSKLMWGFSAMSAGVIISVLSILVQAKVATSIIIILIPFLDGLVTFIRRVLQGKSPFKGDKGHLHHLLLQRGWSVPKIAVFYWVTAALFGIIGLLSSEKNTVLVALMVSGFAASFIILLNLKSLIKKRI